MTRRLQFLWTSLCGGVYGFACARYLFETEPAQWELFNTWPGVLALGFLTSALTLALAARWPRTHAASLALLLPLLSLLSPEVNLLRAQTLLIGALALFTLLALNLESWNLNLSLWDLALGIFLFLLYLRTLAPTVGEADTFEFQVGIARLGVAHGSGYPLLMLVGKLFTLLPVGGTLAFRANLTSAFFGALAGMGVAYLTRRLGARPVIALLAGLAFGVSPTLWSRAVEVEAYTLNAAFVVALIQLSVVSRQPSGVSRFSLFPVSCFLLPFLFGLSLTNHLTTLLLAPACALGWFIAARRAKLKLGFWLLGFGIFLLGFSIYLYVPLRWPAINNGELMSWAQFANLLTGNEAKGALQWQLPFTDANRYAIVFRKLVSEYGWAGIALALLGAIALWKHTPGASSPFVLRHSSFIIFSLAALAYLFFALAFNVPDPDFSAFFIPLYLMLAVLMGLGVEAMLKAQFTIDNALWALGITHCAFALLSLVSIYTTLPRVDQSHAWERYELGQQMLAQPLEQGAAILADSQKIAPLYYLQVAEGVRPDLDIIVLPDEASYRAVLDERLAHGQAVYLARYLPGLGSGYSLRSVGALAQVLTAPAEVDVSKIQAPLTATLAEGVRLLGFNATGLESFNAVTLFWQAPAEGVHKNLLVYLRLLNSAGEVAWQNTGRVSVSDMYPTNAWRPGEVVADFYRVPLPPTLTPGAYMLQVGLFPPFAPEAEGWANVFPAQMPPPFSAALPEPQHSVRMKIGERWLVGYDAPDIAAPGSVQVVTLYWDSPTDISTTTYLMPTEADSFPLTVSGDDARCGWLASPARECTLGVIHLSGAAVSAGAVNFDNQLVLRGVALDTPQAAPGDIVQVTLEWQGLQAMAEDYTVFVHLIGPDGLVYGQVDAWPVSGTRATSTWQPGDSVEDRYAVTLPADAPSGAYQVEVGLYLLATLQRLPVLNAEGAPVDDKVLQSGLTVR